ncbi:Xaa-Pro peptidase family protein [Sinomonas halotolerans]|uniref:Xaa-Pro peptidase family protein n=1 Tax=Sinomonas halotolerans TaxID=1644133 RepID=A0ABU9WXB3_9MICC
MLFTDEEYRARLAAARKRMARQGLSALIVTDPANIYYLTGYNAWSFYTPQLVFVPADGPMVLFTRAMDAGGAFRTSWLPPESIVGYPEHYVHRPTVHPFDWVAAALRERGLVAAAAGGCVGLEMDAHFFSPKAYRSLVHSLPEWTFVDSFELVNWVRSVKSAAELELMRKAARVCGGAMETAVETIGVGVRQCDAAAAISHSQITGAEEADGDYPAIVPMLPTGEAADTPHLTWSDSRFEEGQAVVVELAGAHRRYHAPLARTVMLGKPSQRLSTLAGAVAEGIEAVLDSVRPGTPVRDLARAWNDSLARHGLEKPSRIGYSIGVGFPPDWGERTVSIRSEDETVLAENMTFHVIGGMWMDHYGYELSESIRVAPDGVEVLTGFPRELIQKGL